MEKQVTIQFKDAYIQEAENKSFTNDQKVTSEYQEMKITQGSSQISLRSYVPEIDLVAMAEKSPLLTATFKGDFARANAWAIRFNITEMVKPQTK